MRDNKGRFIKGHNQGIPRTQEVKDKVSQARKGMKFSEETKKKISEGHKGQKAWNKGKKGLYSSPRKGTHETTNSGRTWFKKGVIPWNKGKEFLQISGNKHPQWKGGRRINTQGYVLIQKPGHPEADFHGYIREHRWVMEQKIGRPLKQKEVVHHINAIKTDNRIENLMLLSGDAEHKEVHRLMRLQNKHKKNDLPTWKAVD